jgi:PAS domain S-box-containing protein
MVNIPDKEYQQMQSRLKELETVEARLANAVKIAHLGPWEYDVLKDTFTFNDAFYALFRTTAEKVGGYTMSSADYAKKFVHPDDAPMVGAEVGKAIAATDPNFSSQADHRGIFADGKPGYISVHFFIIKDEKGRTVRTYGVNQDITERKQAEEEIKRSEARYKSLFDSSNDIMAQIDPSGTIVDVNKFAEVRGGYKREEVVGKKISALAGKFTISSLALMVANFAKRKLGFPVGSYVVEAIDGAGHNMFVEINAVPLKDSAGKETGELAILHDITERKRLEEDLKQKVKELEKMTKIMEGREDKIIELKNEIKELKAQLANK